MTDIRYYQTDEKSSWRVIEDTEDVVERAKDKGAVKLTILALSGEPDKEKEKGNILKHRGDLYFDIDDKEYVERAAQSTVNLIKKLVEMEVDPDDIKVYASGGKGFHVIVPAKVFSSGRKFKGLPSIYKAMALNLYVEGMDFAPYCGGRGNCWRIENVKRGDGKYRVRVREGELKAICLSGRKSYDNLVSKPRDPMITWPECPETKSDRLSIMFNDARKLENKIPKEIKTVPDAKLKVFAETKGVPACITAILDNKITSGVSFNRAEMCVGLFLVRSGMQGGAMKAVGESFCTNIKSSSYPTPAAREQHFNGILKFLGGSTGAAYEFSCVATRSIVPHGTCDGCSLSELEDSKKEDIGTESIYGLYDKAGNIFRKGTNSVDQVIASFTIQPIGTVYEHNVRQGLSEMTGLTCMITCGGMEFKRTIAEGVWKAKSTFLSILEGIPGAIFLGNDLDIQKLKQYVHEKCVDIDSVIEVTAAGIHLHRINNVDVPVYVEHDLSVNTYGIADTHVLNRDIPGRPNIKSISMDSMELSAVETALSNVLKMNDPLVMLNILGWFCACHLKAHIFHVYRQFPLLNLWGNAGSGKTRTAEVLMWLSGAGSKYDAQSLSLPHSSRWSIVEYVTSTTTMPRILEEFNKVRLSIRDYNNVHEVLKAAFNQHSISRGVLGGGQSTGRVVNATSIQIPITSPILYVSEQAVESPPLQQRTIPVMMTGTGRDFGKDSFYYVAKHCTQLKYVAKMLTLRAMNMSPAKVEELVDGFEIDRGGMEERVAFGMQVIDAGVQFLKDTCLDGGLSTVAYAIEKMQEETRIAKEINLSNVANQTATTEIDRVLTDYTLMAYLRYHDDNMQGLEEGLHYRVMDESVYFDLMLSHAAYKQFKRSEGSHVAIETVEQLRSLLKTEVYYIKEDRITDSFGVSRVMVQLDIAKLRKKGISIELLSRSER